MLPCSPCAATRRARGTVETPGPGPISSTRMLGLTPERSNVCSGAPNSLERHGEVSTGAKREGIGLGAARRKTRKTTCTSKNTAMTPSTIRLGQRKALLLDTNISTVSTLDASLGCRYDDSVRRLQESCTQG